MRSAFNSAAGWNNRPTRLNLSAEIRRIEFPTQNYLVDLAEFGEGEILWEKLKGYIRLADFVAQSPKCVLKYFVIVECELFGQ